MRNIVIWPAALLAMVGNAFSTEPDQLPKEMAVDLGNGVKLEMVLIPPGDFLMGTPGNGGEERQHRVRFTRPFYLGKYEVTQEQWEAVVGNNPSSVKGPRNPVECINWNDCQAFLGKLNAKTGGQGGKFVLPTEALWEYACRAGSTTRYCFGEEESGLGDYAWYNASSGTKTHPVGEKKPNAWGLYDMHGNVWEWCQDWYETNYFVRSPTDDPTGPAGPNEVEHRVGRGGAWCSHATHCRSASRFHDSPRGSSGDQGMRVCYVVGVKGQLP